MTIPRVMKAIQIQKYNAPYAVSEVKVPQPKANQVLIRIKAAGFCHTDLMALNNDFRTPLPFIGSHEPAGIIEELGSDVKAFAIGDRVGCINFESACGTCPDCRHGRPIYCDSPMMKGITTDGAWAEYMVADARFIIKLPEKIEFAVAAPLMCAGISIYGGIKKADIPPGGSVGIIGIGGLGHIGTQLGKAMGYKVAAVDVKQSSLDLVKSHRLNPDLCLLATQSAEDALKQIGDTIPGPYPGLDATILATDHPAAFEFAATITRKHGTVVLLGQPENGITMSYQNIIYRDLKLVGSLVANTPDAEELVRLVAENDIEVKVKNWRIEEAEQMRQEYMAGKSEGKNVVVF
ncbi:chaperonin 10-like protein [Aspergillus ambiguus]|uniref:zinc-dependent alcohol dehydrogenase n=1 Tax=Aspergillus ambiguus TaxID=176160 RepID=UPI003CCCE23C